jgi:hypothetical protein
MTASAASRTFRTFASIALAGGLLATCGGSAPSKPTPAPATVKQFTLLAPAASMLVGDTLQLVASAVLSDGRPVAASGFEIQWASADERVATVNGSGLVTARDNGVVSITATASGISRTVSIQVRGAFHLLSGLVTQTGARQDPVIDAHVTVVDSRYPDLAASSDLSGRFLLNVAGMIKLHVSAPYFEDTEVTVDASVPAVIRLTPVPGMIIDAMGFPPAASPSQQQLTFGQLRTGPAHLTVRAEMSDYGFERFCGELRDDENRLLWQGNSKETGYSYEITATLSLTGRTRYTLKVFDCSIGGPAGMGYALLRAEHT